MKRKLLEVPNDVHKTMIQVAKKSGITSKKLTSLVLRDFLNLEQKDSEKAQLEEIRAEIK